MKTRRLVSLLLAVLLIVAMIPSNALAAISYTGGTKNSGSTVEFKMSVSKSFGPGSEHPVTFTGDGGLSASITDLDSYMNPNGRLPAFCSAGAATQFIGSSDTVDGISQKIDGLYDASKTSIVKADGLNVDDVFYVGLKAKLTPQGDIKGIITTTFMLAYDSSKIEPVCSAATVGAMSEEEKAAFVKKAAVHADAAYGFFNDFVSTEDEKDKYCGLYTIETSNLNVSKYGDDENGRILSFGLNCDKWYLPSDTTWDVVIPFKAKKSGEATISQIGGNGEFSSSTTVTTLANGSAGTGVSHNADGTGYNFTANDITVYINNFSAAPKATEEEYANSITNRKNLPYITEAQASADANNHAGPYDTLTFPTAETNFKVGDKVIFYKTNTVVDGETVTEPEKLAEITISNDNLLGATGWGTGSFADGAAVNGQTLKLVKDDGTPFLREQSEVWIGRMGKGDDDTSKPAAEQKKVNIYSLRHVAFAAESPIYYTENLPETGIPYTDTTVENPDEAAKTNTTGSTAATAIQVKIGDPLSEVLKNFNRADTTTMEATTEIGTVNTTLDWTKLNAPNATGNTETDTFDVHSKAGQAAALVVPFKADTIDGVAYGQPAAMVRGSGSGDSITYTAVKTPVYGAKIYVKVMPNANDYYITKLGTEQTLTISGKTLDVLKAGSMVKISKDNAGTPSTAGDGYTVLEITAGTPGAGLNHITDEYTIISSFVLPNTGTTDSFVWVSVAEDGTNYSEPVKVAVVEPDTFAVAGTVEMGSYEGTDPTEKTLKIDPDSTVESIFAENKPVFYLTGKPDMPIEVASTAPTAANTKIYKITGTGGASEEVDFATFNSTDTKEADTRYTIEYTIPAGTHTDAESNEVAYTNAQSYKVMLYTSVKPRLQIGNKEGDTPLAEMVNRSDSTEARTGQEATSDIEHWDTFQVTEDDYDQVKNGDIVTVYAEDNVNSEVVATGIVYEEAKELQKPFTYRIKVTQMGREPKATLYFQIKSKDNNSLQPSRLIPISNFPAEQYVYREVVPYNPNTFTVSSTTYPTLQELYDDAKNPGTGKTAPIPNKVTVKVSRNKADGTPDASTEKTIDVPVDNYSTVNGNSPTTDATTTVLNGTNVTTVTGKTIAGNSPAHVLSVVEGTAPNATEIPVEVAADVEAPSAEITIKATTDPYAGPALSDIVAATTVTNNRYPVQDTLTVSNLNVATDKKVTIYYYLTADDAKNNTNAVATVEPAQGSPAADVTANIGGTDEVNEYLAKTGGKLYVRATTEGTLPSAEADIATSTVTYDPEAYTLWTVGELTDADKTIKRNRSDVTTKYPDETARLAYLKGLLKNELPITAVQFIKGADGHPTPDTTNAKSGAVTLNTGTEEAPVYRWNVVSADGTTTEAPSLANMMGTTTGGYTANLKATVNETDFADGRTKLSVTYTSEGGDATITPVVEFDLPGTIAAETRTDDLSAASVLEITTNEEDKTFTVVADPQKYVKADSKNTDDYGDDTDDDVTFLFAQDSNNKGIGEEGFNKDDTLTAVTTTGETPSNMSGAAYAFEIDGVRYCGVLPEVASDATPNYVNLVVDKDTVGLVDADGKTVHFKGLPADMKSLNVSFYSSLENAKANKGGSDPVAITLPEISGKLAITGVTVTPGELHFFTSMIKTNSDLTNLVKNVTEVSVETKNHTGSSALTVPLVKTGVAPASSAQGAAPIDETGSAGSVVWNLWKGTGTGSSITWDSTPVTNDGSNSYATAIAGAFDGDGNQTYSFKLTAEPDVTTPVGGVQLDNSGSNKKLAEVSIVLYNSEDQASIDTFALKPTDGNSDLYRAGETTFTEDADAKKYGTYDFAKAELTKRTTGTKLTNDSFRTDLILYYYEDTYDTPTLDDKNNQTNQVVTDYLGADGFQEVTGITDLDQWLTDNPTKWSVTEMNADGVPLTEAPVHFTKFDGYEADGTTSKFIDKGTSTTINPKHSTDRKDYFVFNDNYSRLEENYLIRYQLEYEGKLYVVDRKVKLTYKFGDINFDGRINSTDALNAGNIEGGYKMLNPRKDDSVDKQTLLTNLGKKVGDIDNDGRITSTDALWIGNIEGTSRKPANVRW